MFTMFSRQSFIAWIAAAIGLANVIGITIDGESVIAAFETAWDAGAGLYGLIVAPIMLWLRKITDSPVAQGIKGLLGMRDENVAAQKKAEKANKDHPGVGAHWVMTIIALAFAVSLTACATKMASPIVQAQTTEQKILAVTGTYNKYLTLSLDVMRDPRVPLSIREDLRGVTQILTPVADSLDQSNITLTKYRMMVANGEMSEAELEAFILEITDDIVTFTEDVDDFVIAIDKIE
jgi:hypothetical protein